MQGELYRGGRGKTKKEIRHKIIKMALLKLKRYS